MILNRLGNKTKIAKKIQQYFPKHDIYMEPFFGAGGMFFNKPKAKFNFLNDIDYDVYNVYRQLLDNKARLIHMVKTVPVTERQFKEWGKGQKEKTPLMQAVRFLIISNYGLYGKANTLRLSPTNPKNVLRKELEFTFDYLSDAYFLNCDFREFFNRVDYKTNKLRCFCYADPPYLGTDDNYSDAFTEKDSEDLFNILESSGIKWAMSEFDHPFITQQAESRNLNIIGIGERTNIKNKRKEILITNYVNRRNLNLL